VLNTSAVSSAITAGTIPSMLAGLMPSTARCLSGEKSSVTPRERQDAAQEIANLYRALRKGREDSKDEPGAADLYYGEMEMRRKATAPYSVER
jgi:hypothetical protein